MNTDLMFSSKTDLWATPQEFFEVMNDEFHFTLDACASDDNHKCEMYYTEKEDGLRQEWPGRVWCNPPYGKTIGAWVKKACEEAQKNADVVVMLIPARTDTRWFHDWLYQKQNVELRFVKGRLKFGNARTSAPFPSLVAVIRHD